MNHRSRKPPAHLLDLLIAPDVPLSLFDRCSHLWAGLDRAIPEVEVPPEIRIQLGGYLFAEGPAVVDGLAQVMRKHPDRFCDYPAAAVLESGQLRAHGWLVVNRVLQDLADRALRLYILEQSSMTRLALRILRDVQDSARGCFATAADRARAEAAIVPALLLRAWHRRRGGTGWV